MSKIDLSLAGNHLDSSDNLSSLDRLLIIQDDFSKSCMNSAMSALFERVNKKLDMEKAIYNKLSNINKFYLVRGALPEQENDLRAYILERFYKCIS
ncbi:hypothetical protein J8L73_14925 [Pseudoalteromonas sp. MMG006]|uniref:hypothetical protein n=1 Tax=Pseudoalteromonas sp. MMG006 TaxID=2822683 RepID=UPI001B35F495|nr:hypothetical protein [Pseudoalteromonas sp. MMG006]MBQ4800411.1 hypothetical protein [Pseudoalteromonas sp. MMG006]